MGHDIYVVPTPVGVFLKNARMGIARAGRPHARGGVSSSSIFISPTPESSPRPWGCFFGDYDDDVPF